MAGPGGSWRGLAGGAPQRFRLRVGDEWYTVEVSQTSKGSVRVLVNDQAVDVQVEALEPQGTPAAEALAPAARHAPPPASSPALDGPRRVVAPMPGRVIGISVRPGNTIQAGDEVCIIEAMKMRQSIRASVSGTVKLVHVRPGDMVTVGQALVDIE